MGNSVIIVSNTHALPAEYKCSEVIKPSNPFTNVCWVSVFNIFCAATNFGCIDSFLSAQFQKRRMMGDGFLLVLLLPVCFEQ